MRHIQRTEAFRLRFLAIGVAGVLSLAASPALRAQEPRVSAQDFAVLGDTQWRGVLRYLDYGSARSQQIPVEIRFDAPGKRKLVYRIRYPGEENYNQKEKLKWSRDGRKLNGRPLISRKRGSDGALTLATQFAGEDDNRPADIRMTYIFDAAAITIRKEVRFAPSDAFFERNAYRLHPAAPGAGGDPQSGR